MSTSPVSEEPQTEQVFQEPVIEEAFQEEGRPLVGETRPGEPDPEEVARAVNNEPDPEFQVTVGKYKFLLCDLVSEDWLSYVSAFLPPLEGAMKDMAPLVAVGVRGWSVLQNMTNVRLEALKLVAKQAEASGDWTLLSDTMEKLGIPAQDAQDLNNLESLIKAAGSDKPMEFLTAATMIYFKPLLAPALSGLQDASFSGFIIKLGAKLPDLAYASIRSAVVRADHAIQLESGWQVNLKNQIAMMDGFDHFEIVSKQFDLYRKGGKIRSFFGQILKMIPMKSMPIGMPTTSMTGETRS